MATEHRETLKQRWQRTAEKQLLGRRIVSIRWMTDAWQNDLGWQAAAPMIVLDDGTIIWPATDDEGNEAGAVHGLTREGAEIILPVIW
jgi:hypothetical protein